jgi:hypothetical protein
MTKKETESNPTKKPWPTKAVMEQVYEKKLWGGQHADFYSGEGSHLPKMVLPYIDVVSSFLNSIEQPVTVCDLGCGDFNVGKDLVKHTKMYVAVDIVPGLIDRNRQTFTAENLSFHCLDIAVDDLPSGDCVILRQVLQHLSNSEVQRVLEKLNDFKYVILTEHLPEGDFTPNKDIISGQGIRLKKQSGLNLQTEPFNFRVKEERELLSVELGEGQGVVLTTLYVVF